MEETPPRGNEPNFEEAPPPPTLEDFLARSPTAPKERRQAGQAPSEWLELLNNRLVIATLGLVAVLLLTAIVFLSIGRGDAGPTHRIGAVATPGGTARPLGGLSAKVLATVSVRNGPDSVDILGTVRQNTVVVLVGRSEDSTWLQIRYPPNSNLRGWIDAQFLKVEGDVSQLAVAGPGPVPSVEVPTSPPVYYTPAPTEPPEEDTPTPTEEETSTPPARQTPSPTPPATEVEPSATPTP